MPRSKKTSQTTLPFSPQISKTIVKQHKPTRTYTTRGKKDELSGLEPVPRLHSAAEKQSDFSYTPSFLSKEEQTQLMCQLETLPWQKVTYTKYGKPRSTPRHTFCFGTPDGEGQSVRVSYMGSAYMTEPLPDWLNKLKTKVEHATGFEYNAVILNNYIDESEYINWHTDDEQFLFHTTVASLSLGASRVFKVRRSTSSGKKMTMADDSTETTDDNEAHVTAVSLQSGSLSVLYNGVEHSLPKQKPVVFGGMKNRYNITFRCLKPFHGEKMSGWGNYYHYNRGSVYKLG